ncbi:MAG TPA: ABC transporter substrate-binding protein [Anaerolineales bacterium]|nr:ABC transporter substrate-binding protein [Anaerolineales bacterium]
MLSEKNSRKIGGLLTWMMIATLVLGACGTTKPAPKKYHVGIFGFIAFGQIAEGFKAGMTELGYIEGENITYDVQFFDVAVDTQEAGNKILQKFVSDQVDLVFSFPTEQTVMANAATKSTDVPLVFTFAGLEGNDLVKSVREPGGNISGVRYPGPDTTGKRLEFLTQLVPNAKRIGLFYQVGYPTTEPSLTVLRPLAKKLGVELVEIPVNSLDEMKADLEARAKLDDPGVDAFLQMADGLTHSPDGSALVMKFASEHHLPYGGGHYYQVDQGALFAYSPYDFEMGKLAAPIADKVLKGAKAGTIPLSTPENHLLLNYKVAQELGLTMPDGMLKMADKIVK